MTRRQRARTACIASIVCSSVFLVVEVALGAYGYATVQASLLALGVVVWTQHRDPHADRGPSLPPPTSEARDSGKHFGRTHDAP